MEVVVVTTLLLLFMGVVLFAITPKLQKGQTWAERFLPEKCAETGKTREDYKIAIENVLVTRTPNVIKALEATTEMLRCFPDTEVPKDLREHALQLAHAELAKPAFTTSTRTTLSQALKLYTDGKAVVPLSSYTTPELLLFNRALYHLAKDRSEEALRILEVVRARESKKKGVEFAEALAMTGLWLTRDPAKKEDAHEYFQDVIKHFSDATDPTTRFYVLQAWGAGYLPVTEPLFEERITQMTMVANAAGVSQYMREGATFLLGTYYLQKKDYVRAAQDLRKIVDAHDSPFFSDAIASYAKIPESDRVIKDCAPLAPYAGPCICQAGIETYYFPQKVCEYYQTQQYCTADSCKVKGVAPTGVGSVECKWSEQKCVTVRFGLL